MTSFFWKNGKLVISHNITLKDKVMSHNRAWTGVTGTNPLFTLQGWTVGRLVPRDLRKAVAQGAPLWMHESRNARAAREVGLASGSCPSRMSSQIQVTQINTCALEKMQINPVQSCSITCMLERNVARKFCIDSCPVESVACRQEASTSA